MSRIIYTTISAAVGCFGFSLIYNIRKNRLAAAIIGSSVVTAIYLLMSKQFTNLLFINFICAIIATVYAEIMARILKAPSTIFLVPAIFPLVPGGYLYYTMYYIIANDTELIKKNANATIMTSIGIAIGIVLVSVIVSFTIKRSRHIPIPRIRK